MISCLQIMPDADGCFGEPSGESGARGNDPLNSDEMGNPSLRYLSI